MRFMEKKLSSSRGSVFNTSQLLAFGFEKAMNMPWPLDNYYGHLEPILYNPNIAVADAISCFLFGWNREILKSRSVLKMWSLV